jgi:plasmid stability protein
MTIISEGRPVANILIRDIDAEVLARLKAAAKNHGRSLQGEIHDALGRAAVTSLAETRRISPPLAQATAGIVAIRQHKLNP